MLLVLFPFIRSSIAATSSCARMKCVGDGKTAKSETVVYGRYAYKLFATDHLGRVAWSWSHTMSRLFGEGRMLTG